MIESFMLANWHRVRIEYDEEPINPREFENGGKLCIKPHRNYDFPNELWFDFDWEDQRLHTYYQFGIDMYEHSGIIFRMQWVFDIENDMGFIAIPTARCNEKITKEKALEFAKEEIAVYNQYCNWECYWYIEEELTLRKSEKWEKEEWETVEACSWFRSIEEIKNEFKSRM